MTIQKKQQDGVSVFVLNGRFDLQAISDLEAFQCNDPDPATLFTLDFSAVDSVDSEALNTLCRMYDLMAKKVCIRLCGVRADIRETMVQLGMNEWLEAGTSLRSPVLSRSEYSIVMNERAFPGSAINTIGFMMRFPTVQPETLCDAVDNIIDHFAVFGVQMHFHEGAYSLHYFDERSGHAVLSEEEMTPESAAGKWERIAAEPMNGRLYEMTVYPLSTEGCVLMARFHHIILDGFDMCKIARAILGSIAGEPLPVEGGLSRARAYQVDDLTQRSFWLNYFYKASYEPSLLQGTADSIRRTRMHRTISAEITAQIQAFAARIGVTEASVFSAALALYLSRASQKKDAVFIMPRLGRDTVEDRLAYGCHTQALPVRISVDEDISFPELCKLALEQGRKVSVHKYYGIDRVLNDLKNGGIVSGSLSEYVLNFYTSTLPSEVPYEIDMSMDGAMHNHLTLNITMFQGNFKITYDMRDGIYDAFMTERFHQALLYIILEGMKQDEVSGCVKDLEIIGTEEQTWIMNCRGKAIDISEDETIPSLFRRTAERFADRPALYAGDTTYTFAELDRISNRVANALLADGVQQGQTVMYKLRRDEKLIPVMLGILKAGAAFIPIDLEYPQGRIDYIQMNSESTRMIVNDPSAEPADVQERIRLYAADDLVNFADDHDPMLEIPQDQLAYSIYTSGSTGKPKGVMLSHKGIVNIVHPDNNPFNRDIAKCGTGIVAIGSVCFDISLFEFFVPMLNGMFIEFAPEAAMTDARMLAELIVRHGANMIHCTPSRLSSYLNNAAFTAVLEPVEVILAAGETLPASLVDEMKEKYGIRMYNGYGPTETTIGATITEAGDNSTIGKPIANTGCLILDTAGRMLPIGVIGELYIYGYGLGMGYKNLPTATADRFVTRYGIPMYKTGDLARFLDDGRIAYHGRNDFQVKIRGLRIELHEIENCIRSFDGISKVGVQVRRIGVSEHIVAFYCVKEGYSINPETLKQYVKQRLTLYMVPEIFVELERMPETPGGKTDLKALNAISVELKRTYRAPQTTFQIGICKAFENTLGVSRVGILDSFYELGGDSLYTAELAHNIEEELPGVEVAYEEIFKFPTPEMLAQYLYLKQHKAEQKMPNPLEKLDYSSIEKLLAGNETPISSSPIPRKRLGNVLLTGASGFLGVHILAHLLKNPDQWDTIHCLMRPSKRRSPEQRLKSALFYFEETDCEELYGTRLFVHAGDLKQEGLFNDPFNAKIDTVINCAANVSHFAFDDSLDQINVKGTMHLMDFCAAQKASLVHISTISVGGVYETADVPLVLTERDLFIGQEIRNQYILSKFMAEYSLLQAAAAQNIPVKIMRVGNLQGRISDGEFQMNRKSNAFTRQITSYIQIGKVPDSVYRSTVNFSPVDDVARMIVALASLPDEYTVFHVYPPREVGYDQLFRNLNALGHDIEIVSDAQFEKDVKELSMSVEGRKHLEGLFVERPDLRYIWTAVDDSFTQVIVHRMGMEWNEISDEYLIRYFRALEELGTFEM